MNKTFVKLNVLCLSELVDCNSTEATTPQYIMHLLAVEDIEGLPPGGGIHAKYDNFIDTDYIQQINKDQLHFMFVMIVLYSV